MLSLDRPVSSALLCAASWIAVMGTACSPEVEESFDLSGNALLEDQDNHAEITVHLGLAAGGFVASAVTAPDGRFHFEDVSQVSYEMTFTREGFRTLTVPAVWKGSTHIINDGLEVVLASTRKASLSGKLISPRIRPERGGDWTLEVRSARLLDEEGRQVSVVEVQNDGTFGLNRAVVPGSYELDIAVDGHLPLNVLQRALELVEGANDLGELLLVEEVDDVASQVFLRGRVVLGGASSPQGVQVDVRQGDEPFSTTLTDAEGRFSVPTSRLRHTLSLSKAGYEALEGIAVIWVGDETEVEGGHFEVDGERLEEAALSMDPVPTATLRGTVSSSLGELNDWSNRAFVVLISEGGDFRRIEPVANDDGGRGQFQFVAVPPGSYTLDVSAQGHLPARREVVLRSSENEIDDTRLEHQRDEDEPRVVLGGRACRVACDEDTDHSGIVVRASVGVNPVGLSITDSGGYFALSAAEEDHDLEFQAEGLVGQRVEASWSEAQRTFLVGGQPLDEHPIELARSPFDGAVHVSVEVLPEWLPEGQRRVSVRLVGEDFEQTRGPIAHGQTDSFTGLPAGTYILSTEKPGFSAQQRLIVLSTDREEVTETISVALEDLSEARLDLVGAPIPGEALQGLSLRGANLTGADLSNQDLSGLDLRDVNLTGADLGGARLNNARLDGARLTTANLGGADLTCARLDGVNLFGATLDEAALANTSFQGSNLSEASLQRAVFTSESTEPHPGEETEPNNRAQDAERLPNVDVTITGSLDPGDDEDWFRLTLTRSTVMSLGTSALQEGESADTRLFVCDNPDCGYSDGFLVRDDDGGEGFYSLVEGLELEAGVYFLVVDSFADTTGDYALSFTTSDPGGEAVVCEVGENPPDPEREQLFEDTSLEQADLSHAQMVGLDLRGANLDGATLEETDLTGALMSGVSMILANLNRTILQDARLDGAIMFNAIMAGTQAQSVDLSGARLGSALLEGADLSGAVLEGANLNGANLVGTNLSDVEATGASLLGATIGQVSLEGAVMDEVSAVGVLFNGVVFDGARFHGANLRSTTFSGCTYTSEPDFSGALLEGANFRGEDISSGLFVDAFMDYADLSGSLLEDVDFTRTELNHSRLQGTSFIRAQMVRTNLAFADLRGAIFGSSTLSSTVMLRADLSGARFGNSTLRFGFFNNANFSGITFENGTFSNLSFLGVDFSGADLSQTEVSAIVEFLECDLTGVNLSGADLSGTNLTRADFTGAVLTGVDFSGARLEETRFTEADLGATDFSGEDLSRIGDISRAKFNGADLSEADLRRLNFSGMELTFADLSGATINGSFAEANLNGADLSETDLSNLDFSGAVLRGADLSGAGLTDTDFSGADLKDADLSGAELTDTDFSDADLKDADLSGTERSFAIWSDATICPNGRRQEINPNCVR